MYVGNIVTESKLDVESFGIYNNIDAIDNDLPTLIIGWKKVKKLYGDKVSILHKQLNFNTYWTFSPKERKSEYETDTDSFFTYCYNFFGQNIPYVYLDVLLGKKRVNLKIIKKILTLKNPITYISENNMVYIYGENIIFGLDLNVVKLFEGKYEKILNKVKSLENNTLVDLEIFNKCEDLILKLKNKDKYIPYIYEYGHKR
jgi:hypothetical protein